jgi:hypothetical protein
MVLNDDAIYFGHVSTGKFKVYSFMRVEKN